MILLGLGHKARHGKDTFANAVVSNYGDVMNTQLISFADPLRDEVRGWAEGLWAIEHGQHTPIHGHEAMRLVCRYFQQPFEESPLIDEAYPWGKQRKLYQWYGTEFRRAQDPDYWIKKAQASIDAAKESGIDVMIFRDLRFPNEYDMLGDNRAWRIKVSRLNFDNGVPNHISETALDDHEFDLHLGIRDGQLAMLEQLSVNMFEAICDSERPRPD